MSLAKRFAAVPPPSKLRDLHIPILAFHLHPGMNLQTEGAGPENFGSVYSEAFWPLIQQVKVSPLA